MPDRIDQLLLRVAADKVQLAPEGATFTYFGKLLQNCAFEFLEAVEFLKFDSQLGFLSRQRGQDQMYDH